MYIIEKNVSEHILRKDTYLQLSKFLKLYKQNNTSQPFLKKIKMNSLLYK